MRATLALGISGFALLLAGCSLVGSGMDHVAYGVREAWEDHQERARDRRWAEDAWNRTCASQPDAASSADYADGFQEGFAHYLYVGGSGAPPPLPPRRYRALSYQTPQGYQAIEDWFAGYRQGTAVARQGPFRDWVTGPSALRGPAVSLRLEDLPPAEAAPAPPPEELLPPRPAEPGTATDRAPLWEKKDLPTSWQQVDRTGQTPEERNDPSPAK
jgi:hypothetical protein